MQLQFMPGGITYILKQAEVLWARLAQRPLCRAGMSFVNMEVSDTASAEPCD